MTKIDRKKYPELDRLLWDTHTRYLNAKDALDVYERRWAFVDKKNLSQEEQHLIDKLAQQAGGFLPAIA